MDNTWKSGTGSVLLEKETFRDLVINNNSDSEAEMDIGEVWFDSANDVYKGKNSVEVIQFAVQSEVNAIQADLDIAEGEIDTLQSDLSTLEARVAVETDTDGHGKMRYLKEQATEPSPGTDEGVLYTADDGGDTCLYYKAGSEVVELARPGHQFMPGFDGTAEIYNGDLNDLIDGGMYYADSSSTNKPVVTNGYVFVIGYTDTDASQTYTTYNNVMYFRTLQNGTWNSWKKITTDNEIVFGETTKAYSADLNNLKTSGIYYASTSATNKPTVNNGYVTVVSTGALYVLQIFTRYSANARWMRLLVNGTWGAWTKIITEADYSSSFGTNGYTVTPGGLITQWGRIDTAVTSGEGSITGVSLPIAFSNSSFVPQVSVNTYPGRVAVNIVPASASTFTIYYTSDYAYGSVKFRWSAIGY